MGLGKGLLALLAAGCVAQTATASTLVVTSDLGELGVIGESISRVTPAGSTWTDVAVDSKGRVFATDGGALYRIKDGAARLIGEHAFMNGLAFDPDGRLYGIGENTLYRIRRSTGRHRAVGRVGRGFTSSGDITFDDAGRLWAVSSGGCERVSDCLFRLNAQSGAGRYIGDLGKRFVYGLAVDDGKLVGVTDDARLLRINRRTGASRVTGRVSIEGFATGLASFTPAIVPPPPPPPPPPLAPVPVPASGLMLVAALLTLGLRRIRRFASRA